MTEELNEVHVFTTLKLSRNWQNQGITNVHWLNVSNFFCNKLQRKQQDARLPLGYFQVITLLNIFLEET